jgi:hypothetical protein
MSDCRTCGTALPVQANKGGRLRYCDAHAPARRAYNNAWQRDHAAAIRERARVRHGYRPTVALVCTTCAEPFRSWLDTTLCRRCRRHETGAPR